MAGFASADLKGFDVRQRRPLSGCIPTGYEILLRAANVQDVDLDSFPDEVDLDQDVARGVPPRNNFESVAHAVRAKYPHLIFKSVSFATGAAKLAFVEELIAAKQLPVLVVDISGGGIRRRRRVAHHAAGGSIR